jgi:hypothetical protein
MGRGMGMGCFCVIGFHTDSSGTGGGKLVT